ncbi:Putrescine/proton symporter, putrescine/ornithine antiporter PotE [Enterobacter cancerogenus]|uniref:Putrescine/proton symporter, putrescine/ornithine antiporter PotE n=1 Tax=Enterobacter cancerogenus TaxID=69218 RepID=A0A484X0E4_9ENTR|nr:Putrescine/proton symporter, putrescine/ornithine antiporter PotE [Enterobacter cancerogenus]
MIIPVVGLCVIGWFWFSPTLYAKSWNPHHVPFFTAVGSSIAMTLWAFLGLESACANADVVENPEKNVPIAVLGGTLGAAVIYIVSTNVIAGIVPNMDLASSTRAVRSGLRANVHPGSRESDYGTDGDVLLWFAARLAVHHRAGV